MTGKRVLLTGADGYIRAYPVDAYRHYIVEGNRVTKIEEIIYSPIKEYEDDIRLSTEDEVLAVLRTRQASKPATRTRRQGGCWQHQI